MERGKESEFLVFHLSTGKNEASSLLQIKASAINQYRCDGICDLVLEESGVDELLGDQAYCGGELPTEIVDLVDQHQSSDDIKIYFWGHDFQGRGEEFKNYLQAQGVHYRWLLERFVDWNSSWKEHFHPIPITSHLSVVPEWMASKSQIPSDTIYINPGMGFGTGDHQTTRMCLELMLAEGVLVEGGHCLDFGTGSGILGIGAIKKGAMWVEFCDIDRHALDNCLHNLQFNFAGQDLSGHRLVAKERFQFPINHYQLIFANILLPVLLTEAADLIRSLAPGGKIIISGILVDQVEELLAVYHPRQGIELLVQRQMGEWAGLLLQKKVKN